jgi:hypothetical protein
MEYLMTYGWAILIIAVVLGALFSLGVFSGASLLGTTCIAGSGFYCGGLTYAHGTTSVVASIGQSTGPTWYGVNAVFVPQGTATNANGIPQLSTTPYAISSLGSGQQVSVTLPTGQAAATVGSGLAGAIWVAYGATCASPFNAPSGTCNYVQIATLTAKAS